jgi:hypothetical protein
MIDTSAHVQARGNNNMGYVRPTRHTVRIQTGYHFKNKCISQCMSTDIIWKRTHPHTQIAIELGKRLRWMRSPLIHTHHETSDCSCAYIHTMHFGHT